MDADSLARSVKAAVTIISGVCMTLAGVRLIRAKPGQDRLADDPRRRWAWLFVTAGPCAIVWGFTLLPSAGKADWREYRSNAGRFSVWLPGTPALDSEQQKPAGRPVTCYRASAQLPDKGLGFDVLYFDIPEKGLDAATVLANSRAIMVEDFTGGRVARETPVRAGAVPGIEFTINTPKAGVIRRVYVAGDRLYLVSVSGTRVDASSEEVRRFFDSFAVRGGRAD